MATQKNTFNFELRLQMMNLISRLIGVHKLLVLGFYEFLISYIKPHQKEVTQILAYLAQASHELVPPDSMEAVVRAVADNFVWSNCASEVVAAGLNALREICLRCPLAMPEQLLQSLIDDYKNHRDKGPMQAARALLSLFREFNPEMLKKRDRGKAATMNIKNIQVLKYGEVAAPTDVPDAELLELDSNDEGDDEEEAPELVPDDDQDDGWEDEEEENEGDGWEEASLDEEDLSEGDEGEWNNVDDEPELEESPAKKPKISLATQKVFFNQTNELDLYGRGFCKDKREKRRAGSRATCWSQTKDSYVG